ncbi:MAG: metallophosphoesterase, partial [Actinomycetota bacterium]
SYAAIHGGRSAGLAGFEGVADHVEIYENGDPSELGRGSSGMKTGEGAIVRNSLVRDNVGNGLWFDCDAMDSEVSNTTVLRNTRKGIFVEISSGPFLITDNVVEENNSEGQNTAGGIVVMSSTNVQISGNTATDNTGPDIAARVDRRVGQGHGGCRSGFPLADITITDNQAGEIMGCDAPGVTCGGSVPVPSETPVPTPTDTPTPVPTDGGTPSPTPTPTGSPPPSGAGVRVAAVGDLCKPDGVDCAKVADLIRSQGVDTVLTLGDQQYEQGEYENFLRAFDPAFEGLTVHPTPGNHDTYSSGYSRYFNVQQNYSYKLGDWFVVSVDSNSVSGAAAFLEAALARDDHECELVYWHHARYSSGENHGDTPSVEPLWRIMEAQGVDLNLVGHEHLYERFALRRGVVQYTIGTGGDDLRAANAPTDFSAFIRSGTYGSGFFELAPGGWTSEFRGLSGGALDRASGACHT